MSTTTETKAEATELSTISQGQSLGLVGSSTLSVPLPFESKIVLCESIRIAGTTHAPNIDDVMEQMPDDAQFTLLREPDNQADKWAIRVEYDGKKIGFVPAGKNEMIARLMDGGKVIRVSMIDKELQGNWWKVYMEVCLID